MFALTSIVAHDEVDVRSEGEGSEVRVTHEVLEGDALHNPCVAHHLEFGEGAFVITELLSKKKTIVTRTVTGMSSPVRSAWGPRRRFHPPPRRRSARSGRVYWASRDRMCSLF